MAKVIINGVAKSITDAYAIISGSSKKIIKGYEVRSGAATEIYSSGTWYMYVLNPSAKTLTQYDRSFSVVNSVSLPDTIQAYQFTDIPNSLQVKNRVITVISVSGTIMLVNQYNASDLTLKKQSTINLKTALGVSQSTDVVYAVSGYTYDSKSTDLYVCANASWELYGDSYRYGGILRLSLNDSGDYVVSNSVIRQTGDNIPGRVWFTQTDNYLFTSSIYGFAGTILAVRKVTLALTEVNVPTNNVISAISSGVEYAIASPSALTKYQATQAVFRILNEPNNIISESATLSVPDTYLMGPIFLDVVGNNAYFLGAKGTSGKILKYDGNQMSISQNGNTFAIPTGYGGASLAMISQEGENFWVRASGQVMLLSLTGSIIESESIANVTPTSGVCIAVT